MSIIALRCGRYMQLARGASRSKYGDPDLERREMRGEQKRALARGERAVEMLAAHDLDARQQPFDRREPADAHLDERHADRFEVSRQQRAPFLRGELWKTQLEITAGDAPLTRVQWQQETAEPVAELQLPTNG